VEQRVTIRSCSFACSKTISGLHRPKLRGAERLRFKFTFNIAAYDLIRLPNLLAHDQRAIAHNEIEPSQTPSQGRQACNCMALHEGCISALWGQTEAVGRQRCADHGEAILVVGSGVFQSLEVRRCLFDRVHSAGVLKGRGGFELLLRNIDERVVGIWLRASGIHEGFICGRVRTLRVPVCPLCRSS
jgi:hypothetical protein